ncbi:hypothetical protein PPACK8108_LOCUS14971 [Phakopsora pachyrhizi]|uniref:Uncharacterized protein n=1 Tax=Phakopsora pachyrhizi TaxID=170000 RepID=A0AAV0B5G3_PHAPC|nr:hypothetical protein PPACK8108_LOCUS14971 [Phakopsora pachyrhizi]
MSSSTQSCFDPTLKLSSIPSKQIRHTDHEQLKSNGWHNLTLKKVETLYQLRSLRTSHLPSGNLKSSDTEDSKYHLSGDQINCSSDWSHLQQTFHLSSNPLRMHNSSSSSASSSTDSWDFYPDLIIPDDSEKDTEDSTVSSSIESALISSNAALANQLSHLVNRIGKGGQEKGGAGKPEIYSESNEERTAECLDMTVLIDGKLEDPLIKDKKVVADEDQFQRVVFTRRGDLWSED